MSPDTPFSARDREQMRALGIAPEEAARQVALFRHPPPFARVVRPCTVGDGIRVLAEREEPRLVDAFARAAATGRVGRFVPASGAATRMFKPLLADPGGEDSAAVHRFLAELPRFPFHEALAEAAARRGIDLARPLAPEERRAVADLLLGPGGLGYAELPKGLIPFQRAPEGGARTPLEEHLVEAALTVRVEAALFTRTARRLCRVHFTVAPEHEAAFRAAVERARPAIERRHRTRLEATFSHQSRATDTLAVDPEDRPFRLADGSLLFRPAGHGALLGNLEKLAEEGWDLVQVKNIDNVVPDAGKYPVVRWKRLLSGLLVELQERAAERAEPLERAGAAAADLAAAERFVVEELGRPLPAELDGAAGEERRRRLLDLLDRPLRVCGVVRNVGEPGGGPFWVEAPDGEVSAQIVETSQIAPDDPGQRAVHAASTHFNPVDLHCALRDRRGRPYALERFVDPATVFISAKSHEGRPLKALERPGLWNGAMAGWNTVFVEVPLETFAPVKTVLDLLRPEHQG
ncbi:MAG TPA: DUF4301 family protein [Thermoanaerobaculia bacterium]|nr:DUF4301 family protein [Thermoanaerobaculia bacterium]